MAVDARTSKAGAEYHGRRDFSRTPEPAFEAPGAASEEGLPAVEGSFVIHRHEARRLHYDLRFAAGGVLVSWAVPRGFSYDPAVKHLAVHTEDHPLRYRTFEGVIPKGEYGAGTMLIWDHGSYEVVKAPDLAAGLGAGEVKVILRGHRLRGEWHLVRTNADRDEWLLFKTRDRYARNAADPVPTVDPARVRPASLPRRPRAMFAAADHGQFSDPDWIFELEFEGLRALAVVDGDEVTFAAPAGARLALHADAAAGVQEQFAAVRAERAVLDGVWVATDGSGRPARAAIDAWAAGGAAEGAVAFYAFDLLHYEEWDLRSLPLLERKHLLRTLLPPSPTLLFADHVAASGESLAAVAEAAGFHALVAKRADSRYRPGAHSSWRTVPLQAAAEARRVDVHTALAAATQRGRRGGRVAFSNLDKVYWPREGYAKGDLLRFYEQVAEFLLPYLRERPVHMNRYPDGIEGKSFFQRQAPAGVPDWVELVEVDDRHDRQFICNDLQTLLYLINLGSIELHPWLSRRGSLEQPDFAVLDLDAKETTFANAKRVARTAGKVLRGIGLDPSVKTSGASGLHVYLPLVPGYRYDQVRLFMEAVARVVAREHPDIASVERLPQGRGGKVYVDFLQNRKSATVVPPYVARPVPGANVSMPLEWDELDGELHPGMFTIANTPSLLAQRGDRFRATLTGQQDFAPAIERLQEYLAAR